MVGGGHIPESAGSPPCQEAVWGGGGGVQMGQGALGGIYIYIFACVCVCVQLSWSGEVGAGEA